MHTDPTRPRATRTRPARHATSIRARAAFFTASFSAVLAIATRATAGDPFEIQVYDGTANAPGVPGIELHVNDWSTGNRSFTPPEAPLHGQFHATLEPSLGITPYWELGAYLQAAVRTDTNELDWGGAKLRSKFVTPPDWSVHWRLGINFEVAYLPPAFDHDRWGSEIRPIIAWHDDDWLFVLNPILDQALAGSDASEGPSFQPAFKAARTVGPIAVGFEYYATLGPLSQIAPWDRQQQQVFEVVDLVSVANFELNAGIGEGLTRDSEGVVLKLIVGYSFEPASPRAVPSSSSREAFRLPPRVQR